MSPNPSDPVGSWDELTGPNLAYAMELYERYSTDPESVDPDTRRQFEQWGPPVDRNIVSHIDESSIENPHSEIQLNLVMRVQRFVRNLREHGHLGAQIDPLGFRSVGDPLLSLPTYGLTESDLNQIPAKFVWEGATKDFRTAADVVSHLRDVYMGPIAYEFSHVHDTAENEWLMNVIESGAYRKPLDAENKQALLQRLIEVDEFERYLHRMFAGQKRFSIEGLDVLVPMLDKLIQNAVVAGARSIMIGMAHRGRLNVLAHVLGKPYAAIFSEFHSSPDKELVPSEGSTGINHGWTGDVKYHLGASREVKEGDVVAATLMLANNPSHLEFVNPVVEGYARAAQEERGKPGAPYQDVDIALAILVHGDAAFPGEGIVPETLNLSRLAGYQTGGTIHIIANNQLGFTAEAREGRSTRYASDLAKGFEIPIVHVSADDPAACLSAILLAHAYRQRYHKDFLIDLIGYRRWGHNEMDDPTMTQPQLYGTITAHPSVRKQYADQLVAEGTVTAEAVSDMEHIVLDRLNTAYHELKRNRTMPDIPTVSIDLDTDALTTGVSVETLRSITDELLELPDGFTMHDKLRRVLERRKSAFSAGGTVDWANAETMAFATILRDGTAIRLTGQDSERGTFGQRHLVLHDRITGQRDCSLQRLSGLNASFAIHNSPLAEAAVIGFEYGYSVQAPQTLVLWEAQFGDFANAGQVLIDQFLAPGFAKWAQTSGLVLLLPHGYEGQGPEHSSARLERYLQLSADWNWRVANVSTAAQYFHLLRTQAALLRFGPRPLIVTTPKSLLRNPLSSSDPAEFERGWFHPILEDTIQEDTMAVKRLVLSSGKVAIDLIKAVNDQSIPPWLAIARVEQLYPFPAKEIISLTVRYPNLQEVVWLQEEPKNMGAWGFVEPLLRECVTNQVRVRYVGRPAMSSPAEGIADAHDVVQRRILETALQEDLVSSAALHVGVY